VPNADIVSIPGIGHYPQVEAPDRVLRAFLDFHRHRVNAAP
jgi:pimeloyl-ACP methyl ester carboxylesterase